MTRRIRATAAIIAAFLTATGSAAAQPTVMQVGVSASAATTNTTKPRIEPARVAGQLLAGAYAGLGGYVIGSWAGGFITGALTDASEGTKDQIQFAIGVAGAAAATAGAVWAVGDIGDQTGSYGDALVGTAGGIAAAFLINRIIYGQARLPSEVGSSRMRWMEASIEALLPSLGATIAFNSSRRYK